MHQSNNNPQWQISGLAIVLLYVIGQMGCAEKSPPVASPASQTAANDWLNQTEPQYVMPADQKATLIIQLGKVHRGDSLQQVLDLCGPPSQNMLEGGQKIPSAKGARTLIYVVERWRINTSNMVHDKLIHLFFDPKGNLTDMVSNIPEVTGFRSNR